jgi:hypothetical protein
MNLISTRMHGVIDYLGGIFLMAAPWIFDFAREGAETWVFVGAGIFMIVLALMTDYEFGLIDGVSMGTHLALDAILGIFLAASPWLFGFSEFVYLPHVIIGLLEVGGAAITDHVPHKHAYMYRERHV